MKRSILNKLAFITILVVFAGCSSKHSIVQPTIATVQPQPEAISFSAKISTEKASPNRALVDKIIAAKVIFNSISIRAKANLTIDNLNNDVNLNIRISNDQAIWISVTALAGVEVARILVSPDSVKILNRIENVYVKKPFKYIHQFASHQVNFRTLQAIILGNPLDEILNAESNFADLTGKSALSGILNTLAFELIFDQNSKLTSMDLIDYMSSQSMKVSYARFISLSDQLVPHVLMLRSEAPGRQISGSVEYNRVELNVPVELPFTVPQRFSIKN